MLCTTILQNLMGVTICDPREGKKRNTQISHYNHDFYHLHHHDLNQLYHQRVGVYPTTLHLSIGSQKRVGLKCLWIRLVADAFCRALQQIDLTKRRCLTKSECRALSMCVFFFKCFSLSLKTHSDTLLSPTGPFPPGTKRFMEYKRGSQEESVKIDMVSIPFLAYCHPPTAWKRGKYHSLSFSFLCFEMSTSHHCSTTAALAALTWRCIHESIIVPNF